jgi:hypothetical protein
MKVITRRSVLRSSVGVAAAAVLTPPYIANAAATTVETWWNQGYLPEVIVPRVQRGKPQIGHLHHVGDAATLYRRDLLLAQRGIRDPGSLICNWQRGDISMIKCTALRLPRTGSACHFQVRRGLDPSAWPIKVEILLNQPLPRSWCCQQNA